MYRADVKNLTNDEKKFYLRVTETPLKERFGNAGLQIHQIQK